MTWHVTVLTSATRTPKWPTRRQTHNIVMSIVRAPIPRDDWIPVSGAVFVSMKEGRDALKQMESGYWKWAYPTGDGKTQARFACTGHLDCKRVLRVRFDGEHYIIEGYPGVDVSWSILCALSWIHGCSCILMYPACIVLYSESVMRIH